MTTGGPRIEIPSFNPYRFAFPDATRVVQREILHLMKALRSQGFTVVVTPEDGSPLHFIAEKGLRDLLSHPAFVLVAGIPASIIAGVIANVISARLESAAQVPGRAAPSIGSELFIDIDEDGRHLRLDARGNPVSDAVVSRLIASMDSRAEAMRRAHATRSPYPEMPCPIFLEHGPEIAAWGSVAVRDGAFRVERAVVVSPTASAMIESGDLKGFSIAGIVPSAGCSICGGTYVDCEHIGGQTYQGATCVVTPQIRLCEISLVRQPVQPLATVEVISEP